MKKYRIIENSSIDFNGQKIYQIESLKSFYCQGVFIESGARGGWIASEKNLSQEDSCWVNDSAIVADNAVVCDNALVSNYAVIKDNATIAGFSVISDSVTIKDKATIMGSAHISGRAIVYGNATICGESLIKDIVMISGATIIEDKVIVSGGSVITGKSNICSSVQIVSSIISDANIGKFITGEKISSVLSIKNRFIDKNKKILVYPISVELDYIPLCYYLNNNTISDIQYEDSDRFKTELEVFEHITKNSFDIFNEKNKLNYNAIDCIMRYIQDYNITNVCYDLTNMYFYTFSHPYSFDWDAIFRFIFSIFTSLVLMYPFLNENISLKKGKVNPVALPWINFIKDFLDKCDIDINNKNIISAKDVVLFNNTILNIATHNLDALERIKSIEAVGKKALSLKNIVNIPKN